MTVVMSKTERLEQVEQIRLLLCAFGSDDEVEAEPAPPAAAGRSTKTKGSSSNSSTTTNSSTIGGRKSNRLSVSPISPAKSTRQEVIDRRLLFLKRVHGSIPVFDDSKPDPGCQYEVLQHRQAVDPVPYDENKNLQVGANAVRPLWVVGIRHSGFFGGPVGQFADPYVCMQAHPYSSRATATRNAWRAHSVPNGIVSSHPSSLITVFTTCR